MKLRPLFLGLLATAGLAFGQATPPPLPPQAGHSGQVLSTDGVRTSWAAAGGLPTQGGHSGGFLTTDGSAASWSTAIPWADLTGTPTSLSGYGITDSVVLTTSTYSNPAWFTALAWSKITGTPTTLAGYGITDPVVLTSGSYSNPSWLTALAWSKLTGTPTSLSGYGITDTVVNSATGTSGQITVSGSTGAVTFSLPAALTGVNSVTSAASTDHTISAGTGNQNVLIKPTGTGTTLIGRSSLATVASSYSLIGLIQSNTPKATTAAVNALFVGSSDPTSPLGLDVRIESGTTKAVTLQATEIGNNANTLALNTDGGVVSIGKITDSGKGIFQIPASTSATAGIDIGGDIQLYRSAANIATFGYTNTGNVVGLHVNNTSTAANAITGLDAQLGGSDKVLFGYQVTQIVGSHAAWTFMCSPAASTGIDFVTGGSASGNTALTLDASQNVIFAVSHTPSSSSDTGTAGTITWDASYVYVCTATNTWKRTAIATW